MHYQYLDGVLVEMTPEEYAALEVARAPSLSDAKAAKIAAAWSIQEARVEAGSVSVATSAGTHTYGTDKVSRENIQGVLLGVALGVTPNPRPWTPQGGTSPVSLSHADLTLVGGTIMAAVDAEIQAYLAHKAAIRALATVAEVQAYDLSTGWPV